jgi:hypothetical protein
MMNLIMTTRVRGFDVDDHEWAEGLLEKRLGGRLQARMDELFDVLSLPGFVVEADARRVAILTYRDEGEAVEIAAICSELPGCGRTLIDALKARYPDMRIWLVTTNDNLRALRTYQRQGFVLAELRAGAVTRARRLKPAIPLVGQNEIPMRDELVLRYEPGSRRREGSNS